MYIEGLRLLDPEGAEWRQRAVSTVTNEQEEERKAKTYNSHKHGSGHLALTDPVWASRCSIQSEPKRLQVAVRQLANF